MAWLTGGMRPGVAAVVALWMAVTFGMIVASPTMAAAASGAAGFWTPSRNIACWATVGEGQARLRCDVVKHHWKAPRGSCGAYRTAIFWMRGTGTPSTFCPNDFVPPSRVVGYGGTWRLGPFSCTVSRVGIGCRNGGQHGWFLSRERYRLF